MGDWTAKSEAQLVRHSTRDLLQKLNQSIKSVEQEILLQQAAVDMSNLKVLTNAKMHQQILWICENRGTWFPALFFAKLFLRNDEKCPVNFVKKTDAPGSVQK